MIKRYVSLLFALLTLTGVVWIEPTPGPPPTFAGIDDDFEANATGWAPWPAISGPTCAHQSPAGDLRISGSGLCSYSGTSDGSQPTTGAHFAVAAFASDITAFRGVSVRTASSEPGGTTYNYVVRVDNSSKMEIRSCHSGSTCETLGLPMEIPAIAGSGDPDTGDVLGLLVSGTPNSGSGDLELCGFFIESEDITTEDWQDPTTWGNAIACRYEGAGVTALAAYSDCTTTPSLGGTDCEDVGADPDLDNAPASQTDVAIYSGTTGDTDFEWFIGGDL